MPQVEKERVVETQGTLPDGREVKRVVETAHVVETPTEARAGETGTGLSTALFLSCAVCLLAMAGLWYYFFA
jgi:hypothetical protein